MLIKKSLIALIASLSSAITLTSLGVVTYRNYINNKEDGSQSFDFPANDISDSDIVMDGLLDSKYGGSAFSFGPSSCVSVYTYHGESALYFYFDVIDDKVISRAIGNNNAQDEDGIEISIDRLLDGGTTAQLDDLRIYLGVSGYSKVIKGTGSGWDTSTMVGFGGTLVRKIKEGTTINDNTNSDTGYCLEYRIPYISIFGDANSSTPIALAFVHSGLNEISGTRTRTGMSGHKDFKIPSADNPNAFIVLSGSGQFYLRKDYNNLNENLPTVLGRVYNKNNEPMSKVSVEGYYKANSYRKYNTTTDDNGYFAFENIETGGDFIVKVSRNGYLPYQLTYNQTNLLYANGAEYYQEFYLLPDNIATTNYSGDITALDENNLSGFQVKLLGHEDNVATTDSSGHFTLPVYQGVDSNILLISKNNFETQKIVLKDQQNSTFEIYHSLVSLAKPSGLDLSFNNAYISANKGINGVFIKALTYYPILGNERLEVSFNTGKESGFYDNYCSDDYRLIINNDEANVYKYDESSHSFDVKMNDNPIPYQTVIDNLYENTICVPYELIGVDKDATFGIASSFYNGESYQQSYVDKNIAKDGQIDYSSTASYLRFAKNNEVYFAPNNLDNKFLYYYHAVSGSSDEDIPNNADRIYLNYERNNKGLTLEVTVDDGFGMHFNPAYLSGMEAINIILNLDGVDLNSWALYKSGSACYDVNLRIYSDNNVCYINSSDVASKASNQLWWSDKSHNNGVAKNFTLSSAQLEEDKYEVIYGRGCRIYKLHFTYEDLLRMGNAPEGTVLNENSPISFGAYEISETSKTTVRFYTSSGDSWVYLNRAIMNKTVNYASQSTYVSLTKNKENE